MRTSASAVTRDRVNTKECWEVTVPYSTCGRDVGGVHTKVSRTLWCTSIRNSVGVWGECVFLLHVGVSVLRLTLRPYTFISSVYAFRLY